MVSDYLTFVRELPRSFSEIGAMLPSSPQLGRLMVRPISEAGGPVKILEVGPGTGPFTRQIVRLMGPEDSFVVCEINTRFMKLLRRSMEGSPDFQRNRDRVHFFEGPVQNLPQDYGDIKFDVIVSSLPFLNFNPDTVDEIFRLFENMLAPGGSLTFFHYMGLPKIRMLLPDHQTRNRVRGVEDVIDRWCDRVEHLGRVKRRYSYLNFPPAMSIEFAYSN